MLKCVPLRLLLLTFVTHWGQWRRWLRGPPWFVAWYRNTERPQGGSRGAEGCPSDLREGPHWSHCHWEKGTRGGNLTQNHFHSGGHWGSHRLPASAGRKALSAIISLSVWDDNMGSDGTVFLKTDLQGRNIQYTQSRQLFLTCMSDIRDPTVSRTFGSWTGQVWWLPWRPVSSWRRIPSFWSNSQSSSSMPSHPWNEIMTCNGNTQHCVFHAFRSKDNNMKVSLDSHSWGLRFTANWSSLNTLYCTICSPSLPMISVSPFHRNNYVLSMSF